METFAEILPHAFEHALIDTLKLVPFLFVTYLAMEALEHYASSKSIAAVRRAGTAGRSSIGTSARDSHGVHL